MSGPITTIGCKELVYLDAKEGASRDAAGRVRKPCGGQKRTADPDESLRTDPENLVEPVTRRNPGSPLRRTSKSVRRFADGLNKMGHKTRHRMVGELLRQVG